MMHTFTSMHRLYQHKTEKKLQLLKGENKVDQLKMYGITTQLIDIGCDLGQP